MTGVIRYFEIQGKRSASAAGHGLTVGSDVLYHFVLHLWEGLMDRLDHDAHYRSLLYAHSSNISARSRANLVLEIVKIAVAEGRSTDALSIVRKKDSALGLEK